MAGKIDMKKQHEELFAPKREPHFVNVPRFRHMVIDGEGSPQNTAFQDAIGALYSTANRTKFRLKATERDDFVVPPLECLWWADDLSAFDENRQDEWRWTLMVVAPNHVTEEDLRQTLDELDQKRKSTAAHRSMRTELLDEGRAVQCLQVGPYDTMREPIAALQELAKAHRLKLSGKHHEIYLSDPQRTAAEKLRTVLRRPAC